MSMQYMFYEVMLKYIGKLGRYLYEQNKTQQI